MNTWDRDKASCASPQEGTLVPLRYSSRNRRVVPRPTAGYNRRGMGAKRSMPIPSHHQAPTGKRRIIPSARMLMASKGQSPILGTRASSVNRGIRSTNRPYAGRTTAMSPPLPSGPPPPRGYSARISARRNQMEEDDDDDDEDEDGMDEDYE